MKLPYLLFLLALGLFPSAARACEYTEQQGCLEIDILAVHHNPHVPALQQLLASGEAGTRDVSSVYGERGQVAVDIYTAVKRGEATLASGCFKTPIRVWNAKLSVPTSRMRVYRTRPGAAPGDSLEPSVLQGGFVRSQVEAFDAVTNASLGFGYEYVLEVCGGKAALQVPWEFLPPGSFVQITPLVAAEFPHRLMGNTFGLWLTPSRLDYMRQNGVQPHQWEWVIVPIVLPERVSPTPSTPPIS